MRSLARLTSFPPPSFTPFTSFTSLAALALALGLVCVGSCTCGPTGDVDCGDGTVEPGEDEASCCLDTGCAFGVCVADRDHENGACTAAWLEQCADAASDGCVGPYQCTGVDDAAPPEYDCAACGCFAGDECVDGLCLSAAVRDAVRDAPTVAADLDLDDYLALLSDLGDAPFFDADGLAALVEEGARADERTAALVVGLDAADTSGDGARVLGDVIAGLTDRLGIEVAHEVAQAGLESASFLSTSPSPVDAPDSDSAPLCTAVGEAVGASLLQDGLTVAVVEPDRSSKDTCLYPGSFARCRPPHVADCVERASRLAETLVVFDGKTLFGVLDQGLLLRAGRASPESRDGLLQELINAYAALVADRFPIDVADATTAGGDTDAVWVRAAAPRDDRVTYVVVYRPGAAGGLEAQRLLAYRVVWVDAAAQAYLVAHDMQTGDCRFALGIPITMTCENDGATLVARVDPTNYSLIDVTTTP